VWCSLCDRSSVVSVETDLCQTEGQTDRHMTTANTCIYSNARVKTGVRMNGTDMTGPCTTVQYGLIMLTCGN